MEEIVYQHVFELIFKRIHDPIVLEKFKRVNINWNQSIDKILETTDLWKNACLNEIPSESMTSMITRLFPTVHFENYHQLNDSILWRSLYISYRKSMILSKLQPVIQVNYDFSELLRPYDYFYSLASCDKFLAVREYNGKIYVFDINQLNEPLYTVDFQNPISAIKFWFPDTGELFLVAIILPHHIKFWNLGRMVEVPCIGNAKGSYICSGTIDRLLIMHIKRGLFEYKHTDDGITAYRIMDRLEPRALSMQLHSENNKITIVADYPNFLRLFNYRLPTSDEGNDLIEVNRRSHYDEREFTDSIHYRPPAYLFLTSNVILRIKNIAEISSLIFYDPRFNWRIHYPFEKFGKKNVVTSGILHGKLLILGFKSGHVRIFTVENIELLRRSNLSLRSGIEYHVADKSIKWLELFETRKKLVIIAMADLKVYSINFYPNRTRIKNDKCTIL
ncbi:uncharacterized protein LOC130675616 [Microplitis mediator]|uniref:uncharacterized protein LOC130675616 n=1 Tax=Microplitis mediator TaxID=375433 RepID=UPI0025544DA0|nr:uncharacterized protein LOC130675616 [Microplitis mediator]XP_057337385.1 uncharacterized protein LOC130675616 [Microplitis mediator]